MGTSGGYFHCVVMHKIFRTSGRFNLVGARRQLNRLAAVAIDLVVKEKIGSQPARTRRVNSTTGVSNFELTRRRSSIPVNDVEYDLDRWFTLK